MRGGVSPSRGSTSVGPRNRAVGRGTLPGLMNSRIPAGSVALVTGSSSGFGLLSCVALARRGLRVFASMRDLDRSDRLDAAMAEAGVRCDKVRLDVTEPGSIASAMDSITREVRGDGRVAGDTTSTQTSGSGTTNPTLCPVDVLVNNAGYALAGMIEDVTMDELREQMETNLFGAVAVAKAVIPGMRERRRGRLINISSMSGRVGQPGLGAYAASKFALEGLSESLRHELLPHGVYVVLIEPGMFQTDIFERNRRVAARAFDPGSPNYSASMRMKAVIEGRLQRTSSDPRMVAEAVVNAVSSGRPRLRYPVGWDAAVLGAVERVVPFGLWERVVGRFIGQE